jgi:hypothetical protein
MTENACPSSYEVNPLLSVLIYAVDGRANVCFVVDACILIFCSLQKRKH